MEAESRLVIPLEEAGLAQVAEVGGKNASLGEMIRALSPKGVNVPAGFAVTAAGYRLFLREAGLERVITDALSGLDVRRTVELQKRGRAIRDALRAAALPAALERETLAAYERLCESVCGVAVRSSATAEDLPEASFAGQQESFLNVAGPADLLDCLKRCYASLFTDRAISYRAEHGFSHEKLALSIGVQRMVRADLACSGVAFTIDTESGFRDAVLISAAYGLGENIVQGTVSTDEYLVFKPTLKAGFKPILRKTLGSKELRLVHDTIGTKRVRNEPVPAAERSRFALSDEEILTLARWACLVEDHYSAKAARACPMDLEWAKDGLDGKLYLVQARPETVQWRKETDVIETYRLSRASTVLVSGRSVGDRIGRGRVRVLRGVEGLGEFRNEYAHLLGGEVFEPKEENPMLGFRGASRYAHPRYREGFALECRAVRRVREEMGLKNLKLMIPFCRTVAEGRAVLAEMAQHGLRRGEDGLEVYVMCEIPSNVILAERFAEIFDGFSIGSNDLTQLVLGVDRDSEIVAPLFDERDEAVKRMIAEVIRVARAKGRKIGICGQAPSDYPEFARWLVEQGIDSLSLNPDAVLKTTLIVLEAERAMRVLPSPAS